MNKVTLFGRLVKDPELRKSAKSNLSVASFTLAVRRKTKNAAGEYESDFVRCVAWRNLAELIMQYFFKGSRILVCGSLRTDSYEKDGKKQYSTYVVVDDINFVDKADKQASEAPAKTSSQSRSASAQAKPQAGGNNSVDDFPFPDDFPF